MAKLQVRCPTCSKNNFIEVSDDEVKKAARGLFTVNIEEGIICEHSFVAYVDKNFVVRDTFKADFQIELPDAISEDITEIEKDFSDLFEIDLIKLNLTASVLGYVLRAMIYKKKIVIISDQEYMFSQISNFFDYLTQNTFNIDLTVITEEDYNIQTFGEHFAFKGREVINDFDSKIQSTKLNVEKTIIQKFLSEYDPLTSLIIIKNEIQKAFELSETIIGVISNIKKNEKIYSKKMISDLERKHEVKISIAYLDYLYEIVENFFEVKIPRSSDISNFLSTL
ncbi:MAG: hypothetical protein ACFE8M_12935 [Candidatus Hermodarchaeota archaeon]